MFKPNFLARAFIVEDIFSGEAYLFFYAPKGGKDEIVLTHYNTFTFFTFSKKYDDTISF